MKLNIFFLTLSPLFLLIISTSSFDVNIYIYYFLAFFIFLAFFSEQNIKSWFWLSIYLICYSLPHLSIYYFYGENYTIADDNLKRIMNDSDYNLQGLRLLSSFIIYLYIGNAFFNILFIKNFNQIKYSREFKNNQIYFKNKYLLFLILSILAAYSISRINYDIVLGPYSLKSLNLLFALCYILNFLILCYFFNKNKNNNFLAIFFISYVLILGTFGIRQIIFWLFISLIIATFFKSYTENKKINWLSISFYTFIIILIFGLILGYRVNKDLNFIILLRAIKLSYLGILAETSNTYYNFMAVFNHLSMDNMTDKPDLFFMKNFTDIFYYLIPAQIFPSKYEYIELVKLGNEFRLKPFGTYFYLGELKLGLRYNYLMYIFAIMLGFTTEFFLFYVLKKKDRLLSALYVSFIVIAIIYPVRGSIAGGLKIYITYSLIMYYFIKYKIIFKD